MKTRLSKISFIMIVIGFVMMSGNLIPPCEPNSMIQTLWTRACDVTNAILLLTANILSFVVLLIGIVIFFSSWGAERIKKRNHYE